MTKTTIAKTNKGIIKNALGPTNAGSSKSSNNKKNKNKKVNTIVLV